jgi:thioredoxin reductase (NADPH)
MFFDVGNVKLKNEVKEYYDIVIIGGGPAGISAAIYAIQGGITPLIIEKSLDGGQMNLTQLVENYPGFLSIEGAKIAEKMGEHAKHFGTEFLYDEVKEVNILNDEKIIKTFSGKEIKAKVIIVATGANPRPLGAEGEKKFAGKGVSYCATCDGHFFKDKEIAVLGGGNTALEETLYLSKIAKKITIIHRRDVFRADKSYQDKVFKLNNVDFLFDTQVLEFKGTNLVEKLILKNLKTDEIFEKSFEGIFVFIGLKPVVNFIKNIVNLDENGYVLTDKNFMTNIDGIYGVGDVIHKELRQIVTAVSDGASAASHAIRKYFN